MTAVSVEWLEAAPEGASFSYASEDSTSFWVKAGDSWKGSREQGLPVIATISTQDLIDNLGAYDRSALKVVSEGKLPEPQERPQAPAEDAEPDADVDPSILDDEEPEEEPEPAEEPEEEPEAEEPTAPTVTPERLIGLRSLILSRKDDPTTPELVEKFRKDYAAFSEGKSQADVDALIAG